MANYFKMKNDKLIELLEAKGIEVPMNEETGRLNRQKAASILSELETDEEKQASKDNEMVEFTLHGDGTEVGQQAVYVGIIDVAGGRNYSALIPREKPVITPAFVYDYLQTLYDKEIIPTEDYETGRVTNKTRQIKRFKTTEHDRFEKV